MKADITPDEETRLRRTLAFMESTSPSTSGDFDLPVIDHHAAKRRRSVLAFAAGLTLVLAALLPVLFLLPDAPTDLALPSGESDLAEVEEDGPTSTSHAGDRSLIEVMKRGGLTLTLRGDRSNPCLEILSENGMAGGCGVDLDAPLHLGVGSLGNDAFVDGWAPSDAVRVVVTLADGTEIEATELVTVEGYQVRFFLEVLPLSDGTEAELPITAIAFDQGGNILAQSTLQDPIEVSQTQSGRGPVDDSALAPIDVIPGSVVELAYIDLPDLGQIGLYQADVRAASSGEILSCLHLSPYGGSFCGQDPLSQRPWETFPYGLSFGASCVDPKVTNTAVFGLPIDIETVVFTLTDGSEIEVGPIQGIGLAGWAGDGQPHSITLIGAGASNRYEVFPDGAPGSCSESDQGPG